MKIAFVATISDNKNIINNSYIQAFGNQGDVIPLVIPVFVNHHDFMSDKIEQWYRAKAVEIEQMSDALVLCGGADINPVNYGEENIASMYCDTRRDLTELYLLQQFMKVGKPVMGICRGMQFIGVELNVPNFEQDLEFTGEMHNDNVRELATRQEPGHSVYVYGSLAKYLVENGLISNEDECIKVNSFHHQGFTLVKPTKEGEAVIPSNRKEVVKKFGNDVNILASTDAVVEAFEHKTLPIFAVQWHPEEYGEHSVIVSYFLNKYLRQQ